MCRPSTARGTPGLHPRLTSIIWAGRTSPTGSKERAWKTPAVKHAHLDSAGWHIQLVAEPDNLSRFLSLAVDSAGRPHVSYGQDEFITYAIWNGKRWEGQVFAGDGWNSFALVLDVYDQPHLTFWVAEDPDVCASDRREWESQVVTSKTDAYGGIQAISLAVGSNGSAGVMLYESYQEELIYARLAGGTWESQTIDRGGVAGFSSSLALDLAGSPHIAYYRESMVKCVMPVAAEHPGIFRLFTAPASGTGTICRLIWILPGLRTCFISTQDWRGWNTPDGIIKSGQAAQSTMRRALGCTRLWCWIAAAIHM